MSDKNHFNKIILLVFRRVFFIIVVYTRLPPISFSISEVSGFRSKSFSTRLQFCWFIWPLLFAHHLNDAEHSLASDDSFPHCVDIDSPFSHTHTHTHTRKQNKLIQIDSMANHLGQNHTSAHTQRNRKDEEWKKKKHRRKSENCMPFQFRQSCGWFFFLRLSSTLVGPAVVFCCR